MNYLAAAYDDGTTGHLQPRYYKHTTGARHAFEQLLFFGRLSFTLDYEPLTNLMLYDENTDGKDVPFFDTNF